VVSTSNYHEGIMKLTNISRSVVCLLLFSVAIFIVGVMFGYVHCKDLTNKPSNEFLVMQTVKPTFSKILLNNLSIILQTFLLGSVTLGLYSFFEIILNGLNIGLLFRLSSKIGDTNILLCLLLPHGIFEIPAIIIAGAAGFKIPYEIIRYLAGKKETILTKEDVKEYLTLALISIILIVIAAWIEANITLKIAKAMLNSTKGI